MRHSKLTVAVLVAALSTSLVACDKKDNADAAAQQMPKAVVNVMPVALQSVPRVQSFAGRTSAYQTADVRPQVSGIIDEVLFQEGSMVSKGQPLYRINSDNYTSSVASGQAAMQQSQANLATAEATHANAQANLASQQALLEQAQADLQRMQGLVELSAISQQQYDQAVTQVRTAQAAVASASAAVGQAAAGIESAKAGIATANSGLQASQLDLSRTIVRAPISGISDRSTVTAGALVSGSQATPLVTISRLDPIYVDISQSSSQILKLRQQLASGEAQPGINAIELILEDGSVYPIQGQLALSEAKVDESTGAVTMRAIFANSNNVLLPGMYVTARMAQTVLDNVVLLPQSAIIRKPTGDTQVYVVDAHNKIQVRDVSIDGTYEGKWIITDGLKQGEKVVIIGGSKVRAEQEVEVKPYQPDNQQTNQQTGKATQTGMTNTTNAAANTSANAASGAANNKQQPSGNAPASIAKTQPAPAGKTDNPNTDKQTDPIQQQAQQQAKQDGNANANAKQP